MASQGPEKGDEIIVNTKHCHEAKLSRDIGKKAKYPTTRKTTDFPKFKICTSRCCADDQVITREIKHVCVFSEITKE